MLVSINTREGTSNQGETINLVFTW